MVGKIKKIIPYFVIIFAVVIFYSPFLIQHKLPIPSDTIIGLYHPYRDLYAKEYPNGIPFKNFLITDPVRQIYVWKEFSMRSIMQGIIPLWNPYEMSGKPQLGNFQSGVFYPLNIILLLGSFSQSWSIFIMMQSVLAGLFMYLYLKNLKLHTLSSLMGAIIYIFCGFNIAWLEWGNIVHTGLWLPLLLLSIDKAFSNIRHKQRYHAYLGLFCIALLSSFFAGSIQIFLYVLLITIGYFILRLFEQKQKKVHFVYFLSLFLIFIIISSVQWMPTLEFVLHSARSIDRSYLTIDGWFIPWKHIIQFFVPDFFGNPVTLNYWGTWNYGELIGYIGVPPLFLVVAAFLKRSRIVVFFGVSVLIALLLALPSVISEIPFLLNIPFVSTMQPTRYLYIVCFGMTILASFGLNYYLSLSKLRIYSFIPLVIVVPFLLIYFFIVTNNSFIFSTILNVANPTEIAKSNIRLPMALLFASLIFIVGFLLTKNRKVRIVLAVCMIALTFMDLYRFAVKYTPFTEENYLFPNTKVLSYLQNQKGLFRVASLDNQIMPPNFMTPYKIQTIEGYDPLYLKWYADYIATLESSYKKTGATFNRIITPQRYDSSLYSMLNVRYVLSLHDVVSPPFARGYARRANPCVYQ